MNGLAIPFPQKASATYDVNAIISADLVGGNFVFDLSNTQNLFSANAGTLYRVVSACINANVTEKDFISAFIPSADNVFPIVRLVYLPENNLVPKRGFACRNFGTDRETLCYYSPPSDNTVLAANVIGEFDGALLPGLTSLAISVSFTVQELQSASYLAAYMEGKF